MEATSFAESDAVLARPADLSEAECNPLAICRGMLNNLPVVISCHKATAEELAEINRTGRVWLVVVGLTMPPVILSGTSPFAWSDLVRMESQ